MFRELVVTKSMRTVLVVLVVVSGLGPGEAKDRALGFLPGFLGVFCR